MSWQDYAQQQQLARQKMLQEQIERSLIPLETRKNEAEEAE